MTSKIHEFDVVAVLLDIPAKGVVAGQVGTVVEILADGVFEVDFCDNDGLSYNSVALPASKLMVLHYSPVAA